MQRLPEPELVQQGSLWHGAIALAGVFLFFTNLDSYVFAVNPSVPPPIIWVVTFMGVALFLAILDSRRAVRLLRSPLSYWALFYFLLTTTWAIFIRVIPELTQQLQDRYRSVAFLLTFGLIFDHPRARRVAMFAVAACVAMAALLNVAETLTLVTFPDVQGYRTGGRAAGLYFNPNTSGLAIAMGLAVVTERIPKICRVPLLLVSAFGVAATFSRGAMIALALVFLWLVWRKALGTGYVVVAAVGGVCLCLYAIGYLESHDLLNSNTAARLRLAADDSGRLELALKAWGLFLSAPLLGHGLGSTIVWEGGVRAHNMYVTLAADHGVLGLLTYPAFCLALVKVNRGAICLAVLLLIAGVFSHAVLEDRYSLLLVALAASQALEAPQAEDLTLREAVANV